MKVVTIPKKGAAFIAQIRRTTFMMEFINREAEASSVCDGRCSTSENLSARDVRRVFLIIYSQANSNIVPTCEAFAHIVLDAFENAVPKSNCTVIHWVCSQESHVAGGVHYHMVVKLSALRRWLRVRNYIDQEYGMKVNFSDRHENHYTAWRYTTKEDSLAVH